MQRRWLGDALDFWKGSFLDVLRSCSPSPLDLRVLPMFTGSGWNAAEIDTYARILGVSATALLVTAQLTKAGRAGYFARCSRQITGDVFIDPDIGIETSRPGPAYVSVDEVIALLAQDNVVAVYQHRPRRGRAPWLVKYVALVSAKGAITIGYESAQVGMLFVTRSSARGVALRLALSTRLGAVASARGALPGRMI
ncbi:hypothetical protein WMF38_07790 [Sorangium sp. So ce118]